MSIKDLLKSVLPAPWVRAIHDRRSANRQQKYADLSVQEAFEKVYSSNAWGGQRGEFCSGIGSDPALTRDYCEFILSFIRDKGIESVVDLGCGDFRVGRQLAKSGVKLIGVDLVPRLIEHNRGLFADLTNVEFQCLNIIEDTLPQADLCLVRQVFQHLSNAEILAALRQIQSYRYVLVTEHLPIGKDVLINPDKPHGPGTRVNSKGGVSLDQPPFNWKSTTVLETRLTEDQVIRTVLASSEV